MSRTSLRALPLVASLLVIGACTDSVLGPDGSASQVDLVSGDNQSARSTAPLEAPVVVRVSGRSGRPVFGATVRFVPAAGSGTVAANTVTTDSSGLAQTTWTLGSTPGSVSLAAFVADVDTVQFAATVVPDRLELSSGNNQLARATAPLAQPVVVKLVDLRGKPVAGVAVTFTPATGGGSVVPSIVSTDATGEARGVWTLGATPGPKSLQVTAPTASAAVTFNATATQDVLGLVTGGGQAVVAGGTLLEPVVVQVRDQLGAPVVGLAVSFTPAAGSGSVSPVSAFTDAEGKAQTTWTLGASAGAKSLAVAAGTASTLSVPATALGADQVVLVSGGAQAGRANAVLGAPIVVRVQDATGRVVPGAVVTFTPDAGNGEVAAATAVTNAQGIAQTTWTLGSSVGAMRLVARASAAASVAVSATVTQDQLSVVSGGDQVARPGTALAQPVVVRIVDLQGALVTGALVTFAPSAGSVLPATVVTDAQGQARTAWTLGATPGVQQLTITGGTATAVTVAATAARDSVRVVSGSAQTGRINTALADSVVVRVVSPAGVAVPGVVVTFAAASGSGTVSPATVTTNGQGLAKTAWTLGATPGALTLTASAPNTESATVTARALKADSAVVVSGDAQTGRVGAALALPVKVQLRDRLTGTAISGIAVTFAATTGNGTPSPTTVTTDANGFAEASWTLGTTTGAKSLSVTSADASPLTVTATATVDTSRTLAISGGDGQVGAVNGVLSTPLAVTVTDRFGNPVAGATVLWNDFLTNGISTAEVQSVTNGSGVATTTARLGVALDSALIRAKLQGRSETVTFLATARVALSSVQVGNFFSCATAAEGQSYCWGNNSSGQLGKRSTVALVDRGSTPVTLADSLVGGNFPVFRSMSLGRTTACGVTLVKRLVCWGAGSGNFGSALPTEITFTPSVTVESVSAGESHTCFVDIDGLGWCGGENRFGQLGNRTTTPTTANSAVPVLQVVGGIAERVRFSTIATGRSFSCGFRRFDPTDATTRQPMCWGDNALGQLGRNSTATDSVAVTVTMPGGAIPTAFDSTSLVAGLDHACVLDGSGNAYCWGSDGYGQIGDGGAFGSGQRALQMVAVTMPAGQTFVRLAAGEYHTCGLTATGAAFCWGRNSSGQLGDNSQTDRSVPTAVSLPTGVTFKSIALGELHSCAVAGTPSAAGSGTTSTTGRVFCWGDNEYGQLGDGAASGNRAPVLTPRLVVNQP